MQLIEHISRGRRMAGFFVVPIHVAQMLRPGARSATVTARHYPAARSVVTIVIVIVMIVIAIAIGPVIAAVVVVPYAVVVPIFAHVTMLRHYRRAVEGAVFAGIVARRNRGRLVTRPDPSAALLAHFIARGRRRSASLDASAMIVA